MEPLGFGMQLPPSPPPPPADNTNQDSLDHDTQLTMYFTQPPPPPPPADNTNQDSLHDTQLTMYFTQPPPVLQLPPHTDQDFNRETQLTMYFTQPSPVLQPPPHRDQDQDFNRETQLTMYITNYVQESPPPPDNPQPQPALAPRRRRPTNAPPPPQQADKSPTIPPPFPWATKRRAQLHTLKHLTDNAGIKTISGDVECKRCRKRYQIEYNLEEKFKEVSEYVANNKHHFNKRAPRQWMEPILPKCNFCHQENCMKPVINNIKKRSVNWLFLLLGQMVGCCKLTQLRYFCKQTGIHRSGTKDRVLYLTYLELCRQVDPNGPYVRMHNRIA